MKKTLKLLALLLIAAIVFSTICIGVNAESTSDENVVVTISTDKSSYSVTDTAQVSVKVENKSGEELKNAVICVDADNWMLAKGSNSNILEIGKMGKNESVTLALSCVLNRKAKGIGFFDKIILFFSQLFNKPSAFETVGNTAGNNTKVSKTVNHGGAKVVVNATCFYAFSTESGVWYVDVLDRGLTEMEKQAVLGYSYDNEGDYYYNDDKDCWQAGMSYNEVYDQVAGFAVMFIDKVRIRFDYEDKAYMIQLLKGQYGWVFVGGEIGVFTTNEFKTAEINQTDINHYQCADKSDWLNMSMDVYWDDDKDGSFNKILSRPYTKYWWCTGFKFGTLNRFSSPITELIMKARITFKSATQASLFTSGMKGAGFKSASGAGSLSNDSIYQNGSDVYFRWYSALSKYGANLNTSQCAYCGKYFNEDTLLQHEDECENCPYSILEINGVKYYKCLNCGLVIPYGDFKTHYGTCI